MNYKSFLLKGIRRLKYIPSAEPQGKDPNVTPKLIAGPKKIPPLKLGEQPTKEQIERSSKLRSKHMEAILSTSVRQGVNLNPIKVPSDLTIQDREAILAFLEQEGYILRRRGAWYHLMEQALRKSLKALRSRQNAAKSTQTDDSKKSTTPKQAEPTTSEGVDLDQLALKVYKLLSDKGNMPFEQSDDIVSDVTDEQSESQSQTET